MRAADPAAAPLQALLPPVSRSPRVAPASQRRLRPLPRIVAGVTGHLAGTGPLTIFATLGRHPRLFRAWLYYSAVLMPFGTLSRRDTELVILRVAWQCRAAYEWWHHVPIALRVGLTPAEVGAVAEAPPGGALSARQRVLTAVSDELLAQRALSDTAWAPARAVLTDREVIELCLLVGHYQGLATAIGGLGIQLEDVGDKDDVGDEDVELDARRGRPPRGRRQRDDVLREPPAVRRPPGAAG
nr:carboxymuconolactone decarboxylase family protein [Pseudonocardia acidicola]